MTQGSDPRPALSPPLMWRILMVANITTLGVMLFMFHRVVSVPAFPELAPWTLGIGLLAALPALVYLNKARRREASAGAQSDNARQLLQLNTVVYACGLAELPGVAGAFFYLFSRQWWGAVLLLGVTAVLLWRARPDE